MSVPHDRCGFEHTPNLFTEERGMEVRGGREWLSEMDPEEFQRYSNVSCCWRPVWNNTDRCIWHAEVDEKPVEDLVSARSDDSEDAVLDGAFLQELRLENSVSFRDCRLHGANLSGASLAEADLSGATLIEADLSGADLEGVNLGALLSVERDFPGRIPRGAIRADLRWANLSGANLKEATLFGADLRWANLSGADLRDTRLLTANLSGTDLSGANLQSVGLSSKTLKETDLSGADLRDANLAGAILSFANLTGADLRETELVDLRLNQSSRIETLAESDVESAEEIDSLARAYHALGVAAKENGLVSKARRLRIRERRARRWEARTDPDRDWRVWAGSLASEYVTGYGISISRISVTIFVIIVGCAGAYLGAGVSGGETPLEMLFEALDYSVATFTGIGSPDGLPTTQPVRSIALIQGFAGILFSVLLGYVLGTREAP